MVHREQRSRRKGGDEPSARSHRAPRKARRRSAPRARRGGAPRWFRRDDRQSRDVRKMPLPRVAEIMTQRRLKRLPVLDDRGALVGRVSRLDRRIRRRHPARAGHAQGRSDRPPGPFPRSCRPASPPASTRLSCWTPRRDRRTRRQCGTQGADRAFAQGQGPSLDHAPLALGTLQGRRGARPASHQGAGFRAAARYSIRWAPRRATTSPAASTPKTRSRRGPAKRGRGSRGASATRPLQPGSR